MFEVVVPGLAGESVGLVAGGAVVGEEMRAGGGIGRGHGRSGGMPCLFGLNVLRVGGAFEAGEVGDEVVAAVGVLEEVFV